MKSLHYDQCLSYIYIYISRCLHLLIYIYISKVVVSSKRNKTNPYHRNIFIPLLHATHLQAFKPKLSTYDQLLKTDQQNVTSYVRELKHFQPHSHLCPFVMSLINCDFVRLYATILYMIISQRCQSSFDKLPFTIYNSNHIAIQLFQHSWISRTIASSQHHPRETRPLFDQPNLHKKLLYYNSVLRVCIIYRKKWVNDFAYSYSIIPSIFFSCRHSHIQYQNQRTFLLIDILSFCCFFPRVGEFYIE